MIRVGGATEVEVKERKDRVDDALNATKAAVEEGIVPGGGTALLYATKVLANLTGDNDDQTQGIAIVRRAIQYPIRHDRPQCRPGSLHRGRQAAGTEVEHLRL